MGNNIFTIVQAGFISRSSTYTSIMIESRARGNCCHYTLYIACYVVLMIKSLPIILTFNRKLDQIHEIANGTSPSAQLHSRLPRALISQLIVRPSI